MREHKDSLMMKSGNVFFYEIYIFFDQPLDYWQEKKKKQMQLEEKK